MVSARKLKSEERMLIERAGGSAFPSAPGVPTQDSCGTSITPMQPGALLPDTEYYNMSDSITADNAFGHPSMLYAPLYNSSSNSTGDVPGYTAVSKPISRLTFINVTTRPLFNTRYRHLHQRIPRLYQSTTKGPSRVNQRTEVSSLNRYSTIQTFTSQQQRVRVRSPYHRKKNPSSPFRVSMKPSPQTKVTHHYASTLT